MTPFLSPNFPLMYLKRYTHDFNIQLLLTIQLLTDETMSKNIFLNDAMDCETWSLQKRRASMQLLTYKTSSRVNFHIGGHACMSISVCHLISYVLTIMFPHKRIVYETYHIISYVLSRPPCFHAVC